MAGFGIAEAQPRHEKLLQLFGLLYRGGQLHHTHTYDNVAGQLMSVNLFMYTYLHLHS